MEKLYNHIEHFGKLLVFISNIYVFSKFRSDPHILIKPESG